ncbi:hypothetical protein IBTHAUMO2_950022 [Nitrosopumilaceae archaeon]|nr:hypothetical protein [Nitrosopumilus sp.]MDA7954564.1 hypothetical protein [Nitrosopumilus sp.]CAI9832719.1 hypothetical protein IBTHAUMO2_950022 [Nitrosopumilaceae archaeon]
MSAHAVDLDPGLGGLMAANGRRNFEVHVADAAAADYGMMGLSRPALFIGGHVQMGGADLARSAIGRVRGLPSWGASAWVFAGTTAPKYAPDPLGCAGWGTLLGSEGLEPAGEADLPAGWTSPGSRDARYVAAVPDHNPN